MADDATTVAARHPAPAAARASGTEPPQQAHVPGDDEEAGGEGESTTVELGLITQRKERLSAVS